jgi:hypothetical protein
MLSFGLGALPPLSISNNLYYACIIMQKEFKMAGLKSVVGKFALALKNVPTSSTKGPKPSVQTNRGLMTSRPDGLPRRPQVNPAQYQQKGPISTVSRDTTFNPKTGAVSGAGHIALKTTATERQLHFEQTNRILPEYIGHSPSKEPLTPAQQAQYAGTRQSYTFTNPQGKEATVGAFTRNSNANGDRYQGDNNMMAGDDVRTTDHGEMTPEQMARLKVRMAEKGPDYNVFLSNCGDQYAAFAKDVFDVELPTPRGKTPGQYHNDMKDYKTQK